MTTVAVDSASNLLSSASCSSSTCNDFDQCHEKIIDESLNLEDVEKTSNSSSSQDLAVQMSNTTNENDSLTSSPESRLQNTSSDNTTPDFINASHLLAGLSNSPASDIQNNINDNNFNCQVSTDCSVVNEPNSTHIGIDINASKLLQNDSCLSNTKVNSDLCQTENSNEITSNKLSYKEKEKQNKNLPALTISLDKHIGMQELHQCADEELSQNTTAPKSEKAVGNEDNSKSCLLEKNVVSMEESDSSTYTVHTNDRLECVEKDQNVSTYSEKKEFSDNEVAVEPSLNTDSNMINTTLGMETKYACNNSEAVISTSSTNNVNNDCNVPSSSKYCSTVSVDEDNISNTNEFLCPKSVKQSLSVSEKLNSINVHEKNVENKSSTNAQDTSTNCSIESTDSWHESLATRSFNESAGEHTAKTFSNDDTSNTMSNDATSLAFMFLEDENSENGFEGFSLSDVSLFKSPLAYLKTVSNASVGVGKKTIRRIGKGVNKPPRQRKGNGWGRKQVPQNCIQKGLLNNIAVNEDTFWDSDTEFNPDQKSSKTYSNNVSSVQKLARNSARSSKDSIAFTLENWDKIVTKVRKSVRTPKFKKIDKDFITWTETDPSRLLTRGNSPSKNSVKPSPPIQHFTKSLNLIANSEDVLKRHDDDQGQLVLPEEKDDPFEPAPKDDQLDRLNDILEADAQEEEEKEANDARNQYPMFVPRKKKKYLLNKPLPFACTESNGTENNNSIATINSSLSCKGSSSIHQGNTKKLTMKNKNPTQVSKNLPQSSSCQKMASGWSSQLIAGKSTNDGKDSIKLKLMMSPTNSSKPSKQLYKDAVVSVRKSLRVPKCKVDDNFITWHESPQGSSSKHSLAFSNKITNSSVDSKKMDKINSYPGKNSNLDNHDLHNTCSDNSTQNSSSPNVIINDTNLNVTMKLQNEIDDKDLNESLKKKRKRVASKSGKNEQRLFTEKLHSNTIENSSVDDVVQVKLRDVSINVVDSNIKRLENASVALAQTTDIAEQVPKTASVSKEDLAPELVPQTSHKRKITLREMSSKKSKVVLPCENLERVIVNDKSAEIDDADSENSREKSQTHKTMDSNEISSVKGLHEYPHNVIIPSCSVETSWGAGGFFVIRNNKLVKVNANTNNVMMEPLENCRYYSQIGSASKVFGNSGVQMGVSLDEEDIIRDNQVSESDERLYGETSNQQVESDIVEITSSDENSCSSEGSWNHDRETRSQKALFWDDVKEVMQEQKSLIAKLTAQGIISKSSDENKTPASMKNAPVTLETNKKKVWSQKKLLRCKYCPYRTRGKSLFALHIAEHKEKYSQTETEAFFGLSEEGSVYRCRECSYAASTKSALTYHIKKHGKSGVSPFCSICGEVFTSKPLLLIHTTEFHANDSCESDKIKDSSEEKNLVPVEDDAAQSQSTIHDAMSCSSPDEIIDSEEELKYVNYPKLGCPYCSFHTKVVTTFAAHVRKHAQKSVTPITSSASIKQGTICELKNKELDGEVKISDTRNINSNEDEKENKTTSDDDECDSDALVMDVDDDVIPSNVSDDCRNYDKFQCNLCPYTTGNEVSLKSHVKRHEIKDSKAVIPCSLCSEGFITVDALVQHTIENHSQEVYSCEECPDWSTSSATIFVDHSIKHSSKSIRKCPYCSFSSVHSISLKQHIARHTGENVYDCPFCVFKTSSMKNYREHVSKHSGKRYTCRQCSYSTAYENCFKRHVHLHNNTSEIKCVKAECSYSTYRKDQLRQHIKIKHDNDKPYACDFCDYKTHYAYHLKIHRACHTGEGMIHCPYCGYKSASKQNYRSHIRTHTGEGKIFCPHCDYTTFRKGYFKRHLETKHPIYSVASTASSEQTL